MKLIKVPNVPWNQPLDQSQLLWMFQGKTHVVRNGQFRQRKGAQNQNIGRLRDLTITLRKPRETIRIILHANRTRPSSIDLMIASARKRVTRRRHEKGVGLLDQLANIFPQTFLQKVMGLVTYDIHLQPKKHAMLSLR